MRGFFSVRQKFIERSDQNQSGDLTLAEFVHYVIEHEKKLKLVFSSLDHNKDGESRSRAEIAGADRAGRIGRRLEAF